MSKFRFQIGLGFLLLLLAQLACGLGSSPAATPPPAATGLPGVSATASAWDQIDDVLKDTLSGSLAYNAPASMVFEETTTIRLLMSPALSAEELEKTLNEPGPVITADVKITPRMKAELIGGAAEAFEIQPLHDDPEQLLSAAEPTIWEWNVTARKAGTQKLTLTVYRLVDYGGEEYWRQVSYANTIEVQVTLSQRLARFDWYWLVGILLSGLLIPAIWRWFDLRRKRSAARNKPA